MAVYKFRDKWRAEVFVKGRRVASKVCDTRGEAKRFDEDQRRLYAEGKVAKRQSATVEEAIAKFEAYHLPRCRPRTQLRYSLELRRMRPFFRFMRLDRIRPDELETYRLELRKTLGPRSTNNAMDLVRLVLAKAVKYGMLEKSPYNLEPLSVPAETYSWWDDKKDIAAFLEVAKGSLYYPAYLLALETGMRLGEIQGLWKTDIKFGEGRIHVTRQWNQEVRAYGPVKDADPRWIDFDPEGEFARVLREAVEKSSSPTIALASRRGGHLPKSKLAGSVFHRLQEKAKVPRITFHELRDTFASWYMLEHDNMWALTAILGHSNERVTKRYAHLSRKHRQRPLDMARLITHDSRTDFEPVAVGGEYDRGKMQWGHTDSNSKTRLLQVVQK